MFGVLFVLAFILGIVLGLAGAAFLAGAGAAVLALLVKISIFATYYMLYKSRIRQIQQQIR